MVQLHSERHSRAVRIDPIDYVEAWEELGRIEGDHQKTASLLRMPSSYKAADAPWHKPLLVRWLDPLAQLKDVHTKERRTQLLCTPNNSCRKQVEQLSEAAPVTLPELLADGRRGAGDDPSRNFLK